MTQEELYAIEPRPDGWRKIPHSGVMVWLGQGVRIGKRVHFGGGVALRGRVIVGDDCGLGCGVVVEVGARLGANVHLGDYVSVGYDSQLADGVWVGEYSKIGARSKFGVSVALGPHSRISNEVELFDRVSLGTVRIGPGLRIQSPAIEIRADWGPMVVGTHRDTGEPRVCVGCRNFSETEALSHWVGRDGRAITRRMVRFAFSEWRKRFGAAKKGVAG